MQSSAIGYLGWDATLLKKKLPQVLDRTLQLIEENFRSEYFVRPEVIERETEARLQKIVRPVITVTKPDAANPPPSASSEPFND